MDQDTIITLIILGILTVAILVMAGLVLSARAFTQLGALIVSLGSLVERLFQENQPAPTTLSQEMEHKISSVQTDTTHTTPDNPD